MKNLSGIDLGDASDVDQAFARLQDRLKRAEGLLARALADDLSAGGATGATPVDLASAARNAAAIRTMSPAQKTAAIQARVSQVGEAQTRAEMVAMTRASQQEYEGVLHQSGIDPVARR